MTRSVLFPVVVIYILLYEVMELLLTFHTLFVYKIVLQHFYVSSVQGRQILSCHVFVCFEEMRNFKLQSAFHCLTTADLMDADNTGLL